VVTAQDISAETDATVVITNDGGVFTPSFCSAVDLGSENVTIAAGGDATGTIRICYVDTKVYRLNFKASIQASDFHSGIFQTEAPNLEYIIPAENFTISTVANPVQAQYRRTNPAAPTACPFVPGDLGAPGVYDIGDIGGFNGSSSSYGSGAIVTGGPPATWVGGDLSTNPFVNYAWSGVGTGNGNMACTGGVVDGTYSDLGVSLEIPAGLAAGTYVSDLTLSITFTAP
jgi:hypothetical protein